MRRLVAAVLALLVGSGAAPAGAEPLVDAADAGDLVALLAEAATEQGGTICYGWDVEILDEHTGQYSGRDVGSNRGVGTSARECQRFLVFEAYINYTPSSSERNDSADYGIASHTSALRFEDADDVRRIGVDGEALLSKNDDLAIVKATLALPLLAAERGLVPPIAADPDAQVLASGDRITGTPDSDWLRKYGDVIGIAVLLTLCGIAWVGFAILQSRMKGA